jgi:hypothetical protein
MAPALRNGPQSRFQRSFLERWEHVLMTDAVEKLVEISGGPPAGVRSTGD